MPFRVIRGTFRGLGKLVQWMNEKHENDEVWTLPEMNRTHFDNVVEVVGGQIRLTRQPVDLVFVSR